MLAAMKQAQEEEKKFLDQRKAAVNLVREIERSTTAARTEAAVARAKADGDELAAAFAALQGRLAMIEQEKQSRVAAAIATTQDIQQRERIITAASEEAAQKRIAAHAAYTAEANKLEADRSVKAIENLKREDDALQASITKALAARAQLHTQGSAAAETLGITGVTNLDKVVQFGKNIEAVSKKFHMLREEGVPMRDLFPAIDTATGELNTEFMKLRQTVQDSPAAVDLLDRTWRNFGFGDIRANLETQQQIFKDQGISLTQINEQIAEQSMLQMQLQQVAAQAGYTIQDMSERVFNLAKSFYEANKQIAWFNANT
jgi:hypothetical protein